MFFDEEDIGMGIEGYACGKVGKNEFYQSYPNKAPPADKPLNKDRET